MEFDAFQVRRFGKTNKEKDARDEVIFELLEVSGIQVIEEEVLEVVVEEFRVSLVFHDPVKHFRIRNIFQKFLILLADERDVLVIDVDAFDGDVVVWTEHETIETSEDVLVDVALGNLFEVTDEHFLFHARHIGDVLNFGWQNPQLFRFFFESLFIVE